MKERKFPFVYVLLIIIAAVCLCGFIIQSRENVKSYVRFDGKYYYSVGANLDPAFLGEEAGEIERSAPRSLFNRNGDSNFFKPGAKIYKPLPEVAAESGDIIYVEFKLVHVLPDQTQEEKTEYALLRAG